MSFRHSMTTYTRGIQPTAPVRWRGLGGIVGAFWQAEGVTGAEGYYLSPDPRIVFFFNDVSRQIQVTNDIGGGLAAARPMRRAVYVPAGMPVWTSFTAPHRFAHLDLHLHRDRMMELLAPALGQAGARAALDRPVERQDVAGTDVLASLLVEELTEPRHHALYAQSLVASLVTGLLDLREAPARGGLTAAQVKRLTTRFHAGRCQRMTIAEMAAEVGLSDSWFAHVFKETTGETPLNWQRRERIARAKEMLRGTDRPLGDIAASLGFSDQSHLTRTFRQLAGTTPAAWRRAQRG
ncbi:helix-turn-helix domain-containing protein [Pseudooceanicola aestuarii]|uniref:helix-turn-helix domain-containing protein n=1 Tax=Pseudooceanicola aestuarii TaxID=2697319 RepID=UPI001952EFF0|nr:AraC family transcriptional regulator [Pseudooceanicola aestuarii]